MKIKLVRFLIVFGVIPLCAITSPPAWSFEVNPAPQWSPPLPSPEEQSPSAHLSVRDLAQSPWFALVSGVASIAGLLLALYPTQVRTIPFSLYRSLMWRKILLMSSSIGLLVFSSIKFYAQEESPAIEPFGLFHAILVGSYRVSPIDGHAQGPLVWAILLIVSVALFTLGLMYDPTTRARNIIVREQETLQNAERQQIREILHYSTADKLDATERRMLNDTLDYYQHVQWRFADVVLGAPPLTFPLLRHLSLGRESNEESA